MSILTESLFQPGLLAGVHIKNRLAVAPMTRVSALEDGCVGPLMTEYYQSYAEGGFGLIITEGLYTDKAFSQCYYRQPGISDAEQAMSWQPIIRGVNKTGAKIIAQLMHAGGLSQFNGFKGHSAAPSAVRPLGQQMPFYYGEGLYSIPEAMTVMDIESAIEGFVEAALRAKEAGFDGVELHGANGYLLDQFLTTYTNQRNDEFGGNLENRLRIFQQLILSVRRAVGSAFILGVRFSQTKVNDTEYRWSEGAAAAEKTFRLVAECGVDYIHTTEPDMCEPAFEGSDSLAALARRYSGLPVIANGGVQQPEGAAKMLNSDQADFISLGKAALVNPDWPNRVSKTGQLREFDFAMLSPLANLQYGSEYLEGLAD
ncbi:NADH:flavin oxidoreductase [Aliamphritea ceti]|uniref:NADH:flavin oxidoreductase n=1 Tax=Aliamphritea ceti TaxID=1524258 RepID=UPI0021C2829C|nr:NADH:flavin oxidoreductase [Aliamphritea ceti]